VKTDYETLGPVQAVVTAVADALPEKQGAVVKAFTGVLAAMSGGRVDAADVAAVVKQRIEALQEPGSRGTTVLGQALNLLAGIPALDVTEMIEETKTVTTSEVAAVAAEACASGLLRTPQSRADLPGYAAAPACSENAVDGISYVSLDDPLERLVIGPEGVSRISPDSIATVRFDACSIVLAWPDGAREFIGHDAIVVCVEPSLHSGLHEALPWLDARTPPDLRVDLPPRDPAGIPQPRALLEPEPAILGLIRRVFRR
jgi:hypothetical protein